MALHTAYTASYSPTHAKWLLRTILLFRVWSALWSALLSAQSLRKLGLAALCLLALTGIAACSDQGGGSSSSKNTTDSTTPPLPADDDGDGVANSNDQCTATPSNETADPNGCSPSQLDTDNDGVSDADDACPNTPSGTTVAANGCEINNSSDADADGVDDGNDTCPNTPTNEAADADGCSPSQRDTDNDSVNDADDTCPATPQSDIDNNTVDADGCGASQRDTDSDSVNDADDLCPNTPSNETADASGCSPSQRDTDNDSVNDADDTCPATPQSDIDNNTVDADGCGASQRDSDNDSVNDADDVCPNTPSNETADASGCSPSQRDTDNDTVNDADDLCPNTPTNETADADGCSPSQLDADNDTVSDAADQCPATPIGESVNADGCSVALCQQAVSDAAAQCFNTVATTSKDCYLATGMDCPNNASITAALQTQASAITNQCGSDLTVQQAGFGDMLTLASLQALQADACTGNTASLVARSFGGPHAKLLENNTANPAATTCLETVYDQGQLVIEATYADYAECILDDTCDGTGVESDRAARDTQAEGTLSASCAAAGTMEELQGSSPAIFIERANAQARCMVAEAHGDTSNVALDCGPDNVLFDATNISMENISGAPISNVDAIPRNEELYVELDIDAWGARCANGSAYGFVLRLSEDDDLLDNVLMHEEGLGVCLAGNGDCLTTPEGHFKSNDNGGQDIRKGYHAQRPENPLANWTHLFQPYCTQDLHIGGGGQEPTSRPDHQGIMYRNGAINLRSSIKFMRDLLWRIRKDTTTTGYRANQAEVIMSGTSAGGYGVQYNLHYPLDEMRWENTLGSPHAAFVIGGGTTPIEQLFATVGNTWMTRSFQTPYCLDDPCSTSLVNHPAHAERLGKTPMQILVNTSAQHDHVQEFTQGYPGPQQDQLPPPPGKARKDWLNLLRDGYCQLKDTPNLYFHWGANTQQTHDYLNTDQFYDRTHLNTQQLMVEGEDMAHWLADIAMHPVEVIDRIENGITIDGVRHFPCDITPAGLNDDADNDGVSNQLDICRGTEAGVIVAPNGCAPAAIGTTSADADSDGVADDTDECPNTDITDRANQFGCGFNQVDFDNDGFTDGNDNCPAVSNVNQNDADNDGLGDFCDEDIDNDNISNSDDNCPFVANQDQADTNPLTTTGDACDAPASARPRAVPDCYQADLLVAPETSLHECTWNHFAHGLQRQLDANTPMVESLWLASHNSYNYPDPRNQSSSDPNQIIDIPTQLDLEMRGLEIDIHWAESPRCSGQLVPLVCHSQGDHSTCSGSEPLADEHFQTIRNWLDANPGEIVQVDIEMNDNFARVPPCGPVPEPTQANKDESKVVVRQMLLDKLGPLIYTPAESGDTQLPLNITRQTIIASGKQALITANNDPDWNDIVHGLDVRHQHVYDDATVTYPGCEWFDSNQYRDGWTRMWEDSTNVANVFVPQAEPVNSADIAEMLKCGLNMPSFDKLTSSDTRLTAMVWSWAESEPAINDVANCAMHNADGRMISADCNSTANFACYDSTNQSWAVSGNTGLFSDGNAACSNIGLDFATPATGYFNQLLVDAKSSASVSDVWVNYQEDATTEGIWISQ